MSRGTRTSTVRLRLDKRTSRAVASGHPWIWRDALDSLARAPRAGDVVELVDSIGAFLGRGLADGPRSRGPAIRVFTLDERDPPLRKLLFRRISSARRLRERTVAPGTTAFRLLNGEGDGLPGLVVDRYGGVLVVRPDTDAWRPHLDAVVEALKSEAGAPIDSILLRPKRDALRVLSGAEPPAELVVNEEGRRYLVRPGFGQKTGFFCDQRPTRTHVQAVTRPGDSSLNLFSFTGGFSVAMGLGGASRIVSVDLSQSIQDDCRRQFPLNGLDPEPHAFVAADLFEWLPAQGRDRNVEKFDLVVCDPPALSRSREDLPKARAAYRRLHTGIAPLLQKAALLVTCSCTSRLAADDLLSDARDGLKQGGRTITRELRRGGAGLDHPIPPGFPEGRYLACLTLVVD